MAENRPNYFVVWLWLMTLVVVSILASSYLPHSVAVLLIFSVAVTKALLVALYYMHLRYEKRLLYALAIVPLLIVFVLALALLPDLVLSR